MRTIFSQPPLARTCGSDSRRFKSPRASSDPLTLQPIPNFGFRLMMLTFQLRRHHSGVDTYLDEDVATEDVAAENVMGADWDVVSKLNLSEDG